MEKVLFDTDIGSDIDDAVCLAYLLKQPRCGLLGITTVTGEPEKRAMLASALCKAAGKDIPIFPGAEAPLLTRQHQPCAGQASKLSNWPHDTAFPKGGAVEFMRQAIRANPGEVTLLTVGPLTNIALLFSVDSEIPALLKQLVMMCGVFTYDPMEAVRTEWNAACDPYATAIVYNAPVKKCVSVGLDVTTQVTMGKDEVHKRFTAGILKPVLDFADVWFQNTETLTFHDPLAGAVVFDESICGYARGNISVELQSEATRGLTRLEKSNAGRHHAALSVDRGRFVEHYFDVVNRKTDLL